jgi:hypothetical protein
MRNGMKGTLVAGLMGLTVLVATVQAANFSAWGTPQKIDEIPGNSSELNTPFQDGCPIQSPNGLSLYQASNRPGGEGASTSGSPTEKARTIPGVRPRTSVPRSTRPRTTSARRPSRAAASSS